MDRWKGDLAFKPPHPGEYLREDFLPVLKINQTQFAKRLGVTRQAVSNLINEKSGVSTDMAIRLGKAFQNGARFWLALQMQHDLWEEERKASVSIEPFEWNDDRAA